MAAKTWWIGVAASAAVLAGSLIVHRMGGGSSEGITPAARAEGVLPDVAELSTPEIAHSKDAAVAADPRPIATKSGVTEQSDPSLRQSLPREVDPLRAAEAAENGLLHGDALHSQLTRDVLEGEEFAAFVDSLQRQESHDSELSEISQMYAQHARDLAASLNGNIELDLAGCGRSLCAMSFRSPDGENVWQQLSPRIMGPTGLPAYAGSSATVALPSGLTEFRIIFSTNPDVRSVLSMARP